MVTGAGNSLQVGPPYELAAFANIQNLGRSVENCPAHARLYDLSGNLLHTEDLSVTNLYPYAGQALQFNPFTLPSPDQCYILKINSDLAEDFDRRDDTLTQEIWTYTHSRQAILMELSTSTGCGYCPAAETALDSMIAIGDRIGVVAYHTAFADPYENTYSLNRVNNYGFWGMPTVYADGDLCLVGVFPGEPMFPYYQQFYNKLKDMKTPYGIVVNGTVTGNHYSIQLTIDRNAPCTNLNLAVHCVLTENGLVFADTFNWVERLMVPDENGTSLDPGATQQIIPLEFDIDPSWIPDSLSLVAFIQDSDTRRVLDAVHLPLTNLYPLADKDIARSTHLALQIGPNPFKNKTSIKFRLAQPGNVFAIVCTLDGGIVSTLCQQKLASGLHVFSWDGNDQEGVVMPAGIYICRIITDDSYATGKVILLK
jgi:hypothetical protein